MRQAVDELLASVDALILPTLPIVAPVSGQNVVTINGAEIQVRAAMLKHTQLFNMTGHPAITLPIGNGRPVAWVGLYATAWLLDIAAACEQHYAGNQWTATGAHAAGRKRHPSMYDRAGRDAVARPNFVRVARYPDTPLLIGCQTGGRSRAADLGFGFTSVTNVPTVLRMGAGLR
jgi:hypothetical protein